MNSRKTGFTTYRIVFIAVMAAIICVVTNFRIPLGESKVHFANAMCLLAGLLFGGVSGGIAAGLGSALNDMFFGGYDFIQCLITFVSKFVMAFVCAAIYQPRKETHKSYQLILALVLGSLSYIVLYMLKTFIYQAFVYSFPMDAVFATMLAKLPAPIINAAFSIVVTPAIYPVLRAALKRANLLEKIQ